MKMDLRIRPFDTRMALNEALTARRRQASRDRAYQRLAAAERPLAERPEDPLIREETVEAVRRVVAQLPPEQRLVVQARIYEEKAFSQIAEDLGLPLGTVLTRMRLALARLRVALKGRE